MEQSEVDRSRRGFLVKAAYVAPLVITLNVMPSVASAGSSFVATNDTKQKGTTPKAHKNNNNRWSPW